MTHRHLLLATALHIALGPMIGIAQDTSVPLRQFQHTAWSLSNGAPSETYALAQTIDGYLWLGTYNGLFRFDGVTSERYRLPHGQEFPQTSIQSLLATADGGLWIGYSAGNTSLLKDGTLETHRFGPHVKRAGGTVFSMVASRDGTIWAASDSGPAHFVGGEWRDADEDVGLNIKSTYFLCEDSKGTMWMATDDFIYRLPFGSSKFQNTRINGGPSTIIAEGPDHSIWINDNKGIFRFADWESHNGRPQRLFKTSKIPVDLRFDRSGALWVLDAKTALTRFRDPVGTLSLAESKQRGIAERFREREGMTTDRVLASLEDREGTFWVATSEGVDRFRMSALSPAPLPASFAQYAVAALSDGSIVVGTESDGLQRLASGKVSKVRDVPLTDVSCVYRAPDGKLWLGGAGELGYLEDGRFVSVSLPYFIKSPKRDTQAMTSGPDGDLWLQTASRYPIFRLHGGQWSEAPGSKGSDSVALSMMTDHAGRVWAGYLGRVVRIFENGKVTELNKASGLDIGFVTALYDSGSAVWIGGEHGLDVAVSDRAVPVRFDGPLKIEGISGILRVGDGSLWVNSMPGVLRIPGDEVEHFLKDHSYAMRYRIFNYLDGLSGKAPQIRPFPSIVKGVGNTLWLTTTNGAVSIDTANIHTNDTSPPVSIKDAVVDGRSLDVDKQLTLPEGSQNFQIDYTALSLSVPERVLFRYQLENFDKGWQDAGNRRQAFYPHLPPGHYIFHVIAANDDGIWNNTGASVAVFLPPTFVQSWYFKAIIGLAALIVLWLLYLVRLKQETTKVRTLLYERFAERERIARDLHDTFFQGIQGLILSFQSASRTLPNENATRRLLDQALVHSDAVMRQGRELVLNLRSRSRDAYDLQSLLEAAAIEFARHHASEFRLTTTGQSRLLNPNVCEELCKMGREALCNAYRHARASLITATIGYGADLLRLVINDDGIGITSKILASGGVKDHWGLLGMKERAQSIGGTLKITSHPDSGTCVQIEIPAKVAYSIIGESRLKRVMSSISRHSTRS